MAELKIKSHSLMKKAGTVSIILLCIALILIVVFVTLFFAPPPRLVFSRKFEFSLPKSAKIENYKFQYFDYETLDMKISFDNADYPAVLAGIDDYCKKYGLTLDDYDNIHMDLSAYYAWWDVESKTVLFAYFGVLPENNGKLRNVGIFISQGTDERYYMYVTHGM